MDRRSGDHPGDGVFRPPGPGRRSRNAILAAAVLILALDGAAAVFRTRSTPLTVDQAVRDYRSTVTTGSVPAAAPAPTPPGAPTVSTGPIGAAVVTGPTGRGAAGPTRTAAAVPDTRSRPAAAAAPGRSGGPPAMTPDGVYVYATSGYERLSTPGASRQYPSRSTITVTSQGPSCQSQRWEPVREHREDNVLCYPAPRGVTYRSTTSDVSFYGVDEQDTMTCAQPAWWRPPDDSPGTHWSYVCTGSGTRYVTEASVVGTESVVVGGAAVPSVHLHLDTTFTGSQEGTTLEDLWLRVTDSLALRLTGAADADQAAGPFGHVRYSERFELDLLSTTPQR